MNTKVMSAADARVRLDGPKPTTAALESEWKRLLREVYKQIRREGNVPLSPPPEEVIRQMREERDAHFPDLP